MDSSATATDWSRDVFEILKAERIRHVATVPDGGLATLLTMCRSDDEIEVVTLTTEEEGVAFGCGAWLGGERSVLCMQSSGVGNCINTLSLPTTCAIPCLMLVTMRGEHDEFNPWQVPMGSAVEEVFAALGVETVRPATAKDIGPAFATAARSCVERPSSIAVLIGQRVLGAKDFYRGAE